MKDKSIQRPSSAMDILAERLRNAADPHEAVELAKLITELQISQERLHQEQERFDWEKQDRQDEVAFGEALTGCQREIGTIPPDTKRTLKSGATLSWFASYAHLDDTVRPIYLSHGFSISYSEIPNPPDGKIGVTATLTRGRTRKEFHQFLSLADNRNAATSTTDLDASTSSRCMRILLIKIFNISVAINQSELGVYLDDEFSGWLKSIDDCADKRDLYNTYQKIKAQLLAGTRKDKKEASAALFDKLQQRVEALQEGTR